MSATPAAPWEAMQMADFRRGVIIMLVSAICTCFGQYAWKFSNTGGTLYLALGFFLYGVGASAMILAYRYGPVSRLQPILAVNYGLSALLGALTLGESVGVLKIFAIMTITGGVILISGQRT